MVTDTILTWLGNFVSWLVSIFPAPGEVDWFDGIASAMDTLQGWFDGVRNWFALDLLVLVVGAVFAAWGVHIAIKVIRILISHFTGGGGSVH